MAHIPGIASPSWGSPKKVRFAPHPQVYADIPWTSSTSPDPLAFPDDGLFPLQGNFRESVYALRTEIRTPEAMSGVSVAILIVCLFFLFLMIWFVVHKILLLEVDSEIGKPFKSQRLPTAFTL
jgi:hypothetical protein